MCVVSMIGDHYQDKWKDNLEPYIFPRNPLQPIKREPVDISKLFKREVSVEEFETLKKEVEELKELLKKAKAYDEKNNEPNCEMESKMDFLRKAAALVGIDLDEI